ncbi:hypothetical protein ACFE04_004517 [Oxalis oulophora]
MTVDEQEVDVYYSFNKQVAIPFKWEVKPGVPKQNIDQKPLLPPLRFSKKIESPSPSPPPLLTPSTSFINRPSPARSLSPLAPRHLHQSQQKVTKLKPPPALLAQLDQPRGQSFRSNPRSRSERWRSDHSTRIRTDVVVSTGCLIGTWFRKKVNKKSINIRVTESEHGYNSEVETVGRWSVSSRKSMSPFRSPLSSNSSSSYFSSPRTGTETEWAGFGLF